MEKRNISITIEKAKEWYNSNNSDLKEVALQAFTEEELKPFDFRQITTIDDVLRVLNISSFEYCHILEHLYSLSAVSAATFKLNLIRKALNLGYKMNFKEGTIWYPYTPAILPNNSYCKESCEVEVAKVKIGYDTFTLLGGKANCSSITGVGYFLPTHGMAYSYTIANLLGCATKEIAQHMGKHFAKEIFDAKYKDTIDYTWV